MDDEDSIIEKVEESLTKLHADTGFLLLWPELVLEVKNIAESGENADVKEMASISLQIYAAMK